MPDPLATLADLDARSPAPVDPVRGAAALDDSSALIDAVSHSRWLDSVGDRVASWPAIIRTICVNAARRGLDAPGDGVESEQVGSYRVGYTSGGASAWLTRAEVQRVRQAAGLLGIWTQPTTRGDVPDVTSTLFVDPAGGGEPIPYEVDDLEVS